MERGSLARRGLAVPPPLLRLLVEAAIAQPVACLAEIRTRGEVPPVDTGLDLTLEEGRLVEFWSPGAVVADEAYCPPDSLICRIQPQVPQQQQGICGGSPARTNVWATTPLTI